MPSELPYDLSPPAPEPEKPKVSQRVRRDKIMALREQGFTFQDIATNVGASIGKVREIFMKERDRLKKLCGPDAEEGYDMQLIRCESLIKSLWPKATGPDAKYAARVTEIILKIMDRQAKLQGLDAPVKAELHVDFKQMGDDELLIEAQRLKIDVKPFNASELLPGEISNQLPPGLIDHQGFCFVDPTELPPL